MKLFAFFKIINITLLDIKHFLRIFIAFLIPQQHVFLNLVLYPHYPTLWFQLGYGEYLTFLWEHFIIKTLIL